MLESCLPGASFTLDSAEEAKSYDDISDEEFERFFRLPVPEIQLRLPAVVFGTALRPTLEGLGLTLTVYSYRSTDMGSKRAALCAGIEQAIKETATSSTAM